MVVVVDFRVIIPNPNYCYISNSDAINLNGFCRNIIRIRKGKTKNSRILKMQSFPNIKLFDEKVFPFQSFLL